MVAMAAEATTGSSFRLPHDGRPFTVHDLEATPDDGNRYELVDGVLIVCPAPSIEHQTVIAELLTRLRLVRPVGIQVLTAPVSVRAQQVDRTATRHRRFPPR